MEHRHLFTWTLEEFVLVLMVILVLAPSWRVACGGEFCACSDISWVNVESSADVLSCSSCLRDAFNALILLDHCFSQFDNVYGP